LIERRWKFLRKKALNRWHKIFEEMQGAVADVLDHLDRYRAALDSLMREEFYILKDEDLSLSPAARDEDSPSPPAQGSRCCPSSMGRGWSVLIMGSVPVQRE